MKKNNCIYFFVGLCSSQLLLCMSTQLTLHHNQSLTQPQGRILVLNSSTYFAIPENVAATSTILKSMVTQHEHPIVIDISSHGYSNASLLIFTDLMPEISSRVASTSLHNYSTQTLLDLYELSRFFMVDARPLLLNSLDSIDLLLVTPEHFSIPFNVKSWELVSPESHDLFLIHYKTPNKKMAVWDIANNKQLFDIQHESTIHSYRLNKEIGTLATASLHDNTIKIWDMRNGTLLNTISMFEHPEIIGWRCSQLLIRHNYNKLALFDMASQKICSELICETSIVSADCIPDNNILVRTFGTQAHVWDSINEKVVFTFDNSYLITSLSISPNRKQVAMGLSSGDLVIWNIEHDTTEHVLPVNSLISSLKWSADGKHLAVLFNQYNLDEKNQVHIWNVEQGKKIHTITQKLTVEHAAWNTQGTCLAVGGRDGTITLFDVATNKEKKYTHKAAIASITWAGNTYVISSDANNQIKTWDTRNNKLINHATTHGPARSILWDEKSSSLVINSYQGPLSIQKHTLNTFSTDQLWLMLILTKAREEGKTILAHNGSWASQAFLEYPKNIQQQHEHMNISHVKGTLAIEDLDYIHTVSFVTKNPV